MSVENCKCCGGEFEFTDGDAALLEKMGPQIAGEVFDLPVPTHCPECRQQRRLAFRNDQNYYKNSCAQCKQTLISIYSPDKNLPILCDECFWSDKWDPLSFGVPFDFNRPFFEQYAEMRSKVPRLAIFHTQSENSKYSVHSSRNRNCYMASSVVACEDVHYSDFCFHCLDSMDLFSCHTVELCYGSSHSAECFNCDYVELSSSLADCYLCFDCKASNNLVGCVSLRNTKNQILNRPVSREECLTTIQKLKTDPGCRKKFVEEFEALKLRSPKRDAWTLNTENSTGNFLTNTKNAQHCYNVKHAEDSRYAYEVQRVKDCMDIARVAGGEVLYECKGNVDLHFSVACNLCYQCDNLYYCDNCQGGSRDLFGCMSVKKKQYCILNKEYGRKDYEKLVPQIIEHMTKTGEWGEFFPVHLSPFGYNETKACDWYPLTEAEVAERGWRWSNYKQPVAEGVLSVRAETLPNDIRQVQDSVLNQAIVCETSGKMFRIAAPELQFYRKKGLPLPRQAPAERHRVRVLHQAERVLWNRYCEKCGTNIHTTYAPDRPEMVYCEECYLKSVY